MEMEEFEEEPYDVEEYDPAFATYLDARRRFQECPVVFFLLLRSKIKALQPPHQCGRVQKGANQKGRKAAKGKSVYKYTKPPSKGADPKGRAKPAMSPPTCLRCGSGLRVGSARERRLSRTEDLAGHGAGRVILAIPSKLPDPRSAYVKGNVLRKAECFNSLWAVMWMRSVVG